MIPRLTMQDMTDGVGRVGKALSDVLKGEHPVIQGAALADATAMWLAGHKIQGEKGSTDRLREGLLESHLAAVRSLIAVNAALIENMQDRAKATEQ